MRRTPSRLDWPLWVAGLALLVFIAFLARGYIFHSKFVLGEAFNAFLGALILGGLLWRRRA